MSNTIRAFHHVAISTADLDKCVAFYEAGFGFETVTRFSWDVGAPFSDEIIGLADTAADVALIRLGDIHLEIFEFKSPTPDPLDPRYPANRHGLTHLAFTCDDIHGEVERLKELGMVFHSEPVDAPMSIIVYGRDPEGNIVELIQQKQGHPSQL